MIGGENIKTVTLRLSEELHKKLKLLTIMEDTTIQAYLVELIEESLQKRESNEKSK